MNMRTDIWKGIATVGLLLTLGSAVHAQCTLVVNIFSDTIACNGMLAGIGPQVSGGSGDYSYQWEPAFAVNDPTAQSAVISSSFPLWVSVSVTDNGTSCSSSDSVFVSPNIPVNQTLSLCNGPAVLILDPGSMMYDWSATDPDGNTIDMSGVSGNAFVATVPGDYVVITYYSGCNVTTHLFEVVGCPQQCTATINSSSNANNCTSYFCFDAGGQPAIESYSWDFADMYSSGAPSACFSQALAGTYDVTLTATHVGGCVSTTVVTVEATANGIETTLPDADGLIACNGTLFIGPQTTGGSGNYSYQWTPEAVVNNPTSQSVGISSSFPLWVTVTVTDDQTGCTASDSLYFYPNIQQNQTVSLCSGSAELTLDPGSMVYNWTAEDPDGNPIDMSGVTGNSFTATELGTYTVMTYYSGCNQVVHEFEVVAGLQIFLPDTVYKCPDGCVDLVPEVIGGVPGYVYVWSTGETSESISICDFPGSYGCMAIDQSGCTVSAGVVVEEYPSTELEIIYSETTDNCINTVCLTASPGFTAYFWSNGSSTLPLCDFSAPDTYDLVLTVFDALGCIYSDSISFTVEAPCDDVWPGDVNFDGIADNTDALWLGLAFDQTGPVRPDASLAWEGQPAPDWNFNFAQNNVNLKHADCDGNGVVNFADTIAISQNYGQMHGKTENGLAGNFPALWVEAMPDTVGESQAVNITVHLGTATQPVDSLHGIAFTLTWDETLVTANGLHIDFADNVLGAVGSDVLTLQMPFPADGQADLAITRTTLENFSGYGPLVNARIVTTDNLSGIHELRIGVSGITAITANEFPVELTSVPDTVIIDPDHVGIGETFGADLSMHPNPTDGIVRLDGLSGDVTLEVLDATGRTISRSGNNGGATLLLDLSEQPDGLYMVRLSGRDGVAVRRLVKTR
jgi:hypothetical protein